MVPNGEKDPWSMKEIYILISLCTDQIGKSKDDGGSSVSSVSSVSSSDQGLQWRRITDEFNRLVGKSWVEGRLKSMYDWLSHMWNLWKQLKGNETGLKWDSAKNTIAATKEWWDAKIKENHEFAYFKKKGVDPELEEKLHLLFEQTGAARAYKHTSNDSSVAESDNRKVLGKRGRGCNDDDDEAETEDEKMIYRRVLGKRKRDDEDDEEEGHEDDSDDESETETEDEDEEMIMELFLMMLMLMDMMITMILMIIEFMKKRGSTNVHFSRIGASLSMNCIDVISIDDAVARLSDMQGLEVGSPEFNYGASLMQIRVKRMFLQLIPDDYTASKWIKRMYMKSIV